MKKIGQPVFTLVLLLLLLMARHIDQPSNYQEGCIQDLTCWHRSLPGAIKLIDAADVLKNRSQVNALMTKADYISWDTRLPELSATFSKEKFTVSDLIDLLGEPQRVSVVQAFSSETNCAWLTIDYLDKGVMATLYQEGYFVGVKPSQWISTLTLVAPEVAQRWEPTETTFHEWQGFINYCDPHNLTLNLP